MCRLLTFLVRVVPAALALGLLLIALASGCGVEPSRSRVLLVGLDGASPKIVQEMFEAGQLPHLAGLADRGLFVPLRSSLPLHSPRIWASIATGKTAEKHGIDAFVKRDEKGRNRLLLSSDRRTHALWNIVSKAGRRVAVINWWNTFPPEVIEGVMVSDHAVPGEVERRQLLTRSAAAPAGALVHPQDWDERVRAFLAEQIEVDWPDPFTGNDALPRWGHPERLAEVFRDDTRAVEIALSVEDEIDPDLLMVFLPGIDRVSHRLWGCLEEDFPYPPRLTPTPSERRAGADALRDYYRYADALVSRLLERYTPDDLVVIVSDHGFEAGTSRGLDLTGVHDTAAARDGILIAAGRGIGRAAATEVVTILDVAPTVLAWMGLALGRDMDGRAAPFLDARVNWVETHDTDAIERLPTHSSGKEGEMLRNLRDLGYIE
jgi:predicted AlkP superfamily phosphohydrolase/phosphomutase